MIVFLALAIFFIKLKMLMWKGRYSEKLMHRKMLHCFRHSYAVIQISLGTDIYTVSKMLTHKNVSTTQIYINLVNAKKRETASKISLK